MLLPNLFQFFYSVLSGRDEQNTHHQCSLCSNEGLPPVVGAEGSRPKRYFAAKVLPDQNWWAALGLGLGQNSSRWIMFFIGEKNNVDYK